MEQVSQVRGFSFEGHRCLGRIPVLGRERTEREPACVSVCQCVSVFGAEYAEPAFLGSRLKAAGRRNASCLLTSYSQQDGITRDGQR